MPVEVLETPDHRLIMRERFEYMMRIAERHGACVCEECLTCGRVYEALAEIFANKPTPAKASAIVRVSVS